MQNKLMCAVTLSLSKGCALAFLIITILFTSCSVTKAKRTTSQDSTHVNKIDTGAVKKSTTHEVNEGDWTREIQVFTRDTTINNYIYSGSGKAPVVNVPKPTVIIRESGNYRQEKETFNFDSAFHHVLDSLKVQKVEVVKEKKEQAFNFWQIIAIAALVLCAGLLVKQFIIHRS